MVISNRLRREQRKESSWCRCRVGKWFLHAQRFLPDIDQNVPYSSGWDREGEMTTHFFHEGHKALFTLNLKSQICAVSELTHHKALLELVSQCERQYAVSHHLIHRTSLPCCVVRSTEQIAIYFLQIHTSAHHSSDKVIGTIIQTVYSQF